MIELSGYKCNFIFWKESPSTTFPEISCEEGELFGENVSILTGNLSFFASCAAGI